MIHLLKMYFYTNSWNRICMLSMYMILSAYDGIVSAQTAHNLTFMNVMIYLSVWHILSFVRHCTQISIHTYFAYNQLFSLRRFQSLCGLYWPPLLVRIWKRTFRLVICRISVLGELVNDILHNTAASNAYEHILADSFRFNKISFVSINTFFSPL